MFNFSNIRRIGLGLLAVFIIAGGMITLPRFDSDTISLPDFGSSSENNQTQSDNESATTDQLHPDTAQLTSPVVVREVVDGDTIKVFYKGKIRTVRLIGIDTPETKKPGEPVQPYGPQATDNLNALVAESSNKVVLEFDPSQDRIDKYERLLAYAWKPDLTKNLNIEQIKAGLAREYTYNGPYRYQEQFVAAQNHAQTNKLNLWS